jgi:hypothetical protein
MPLDPRFASILSVLFGVKPDNVWVELTESGTFFARYGRFRAETPIANITSWRIEGPWRSITALGVRMSIRYRDLTFGSTARGGSASTSASRPR